MNIGFISTRFAGTDGVSLEAQKWADVLAADGHCNFWFSGRSDRPDEISMVVPEANFQHPENVWISERVWGNTKRDTIITKRVESVSNYLKSKIRQFVDRFDIDVLILENALTIPIHIPLGVAITEFLAETGMQAIAHHHDFYWERIRFAINAVPDFLDKSFPPRLPNLQHVVINSAAKEQLALRRGVSADIIPNVFNFEEPPVVGDAWAADLREEIGLQEDDIFILQPTRVVPRKGIEHAIKLVSELDNPRAKLVISHDVGDEGFEYLEMLKEMAESEGIDLLNIADRISENRGYDASGRKNYQLWDVYENCDLVTYPSLIEGFGNAFLEAVYFKKPIVVNRYPIYIQDIENKGFKVVSMDGYISNATITHTKRILEDPSLVEEMVEENYRISMEHFSYQSLLISLRRALKTNELV